MFEWYLTIKSRRCKGDLTLWQYHIYRLFRNYVYPKISVLDERIEKYQSAIEVLEKAEILKGQGWEVIASGEVKTEIADLDIYFINGKQVNSMFKKFEGKNIEIAVKVIK